MALNGMPSLQDCSKKADVFAKQYRVTQAYSRDGALLNDPNIDTAYITSPYSLYKNTLLKLDQGVIALYQRY